MPFPLLIPIVLGAGSVATAGYGAKKGYEGVSGMKQARQIAEEAQARGVAAVSELNRRKEDADRCAAEYADSILDIQQTTYRRFADLADRFGQNNARLLGQVLKEVNVSPVIVKDLKISSVKACDLAKGMISMGTSGAGAACGTKMLIGLFGTASTGSSISSLSGAAAAKATMAWLGGGSIAAGGGGVALGTLVLGGLTTAPAILAGGFVLARKGAQEVADARSYEAEINMQISKVKDVLAFLDSLITRINELKSLVISLNLRANNILNMIEPESFDINNPGHIQLFQQAALLLKALTRVISTPVLDQEGNITAESRQVQFEYQDIGGYA